jgi:hypothetical protein
LAVPQTQVLEFGTYAQAGQFRPGASIRVTTAQSRTSRRALLQDGSSNTTVGSADGVTTMTLVANATVMTELTVTAAAAVGQLTVGARRLPRSCCR